MDSDKIEIPGERATTDTVIRGPESTIHTALENLHLDSRVRKIQCSPFIMLYLGSIGMDRVISEPCYSWSFSYNSIVNTMENMLYQNPCYNKVCFKGTLLYC